MSVTYRQTELLLEVLSDLKRHQLEHERIYISILLQSEMGWNAEAKKKELMEEAAWLLIVRERETEVPVAFSHFR